MSKTKFSVTLRVESHKPDLEDVGLRLDLKPTTLIDSNNPRRSKYGTPLPQRSPISIWGFDLDGEDFESTLTQMLDLLETRLDSIGVMRAECNCYLYCGVFPGDSVIFDLGFRIESETMKRLTKLDLPLVFSVYPIHN